MGRIEIIYAAIDEMAQAILKNRSRIPLTHEVTDPNTGGPCSWPETYLAWKEKAIKAERTFGRKPLTDLQWMAVEQYIKNQYGLSLEG